MKYQVENFKKEKERMLAQYSALKIAWESVTFPTKKDGTPFKNMSKNFSGAHYYIGAYSITNCNYLLDVYTYAEYSNGTREYISDTIYCHETLKYMKNLINPENIRKQSACVEDQYLYDLEEIKNILIPERIKYYTEQIQILEFELKKFDAEYTAVNALLSDIQKKRSKLFLDILKKSL